MNRLNKIKEILSPKLQTCQCCGFTYLPIGDKYQDECPKCNTYLGLTREDMELLDSLEQENFDDEFFYE